MSEVQKLDLSIDEIRGLILEVFKGNPSSQYLSVCNDVAELVVKKGLFQMWARELWFIMVEGMFYRVPIKIALGR